MIAENFDTDLTTDIEAFNVVNLSTKWVKNLLNIVYGWPLNA